MYQPTPMQLAARANGAKGGKARAKNQTPEQRKALAKKAGSSTKNAYGTDYYTHIAGMRKLVGRYRKPVN